MALLQMTVALWLIVPGSATPADTTDRNDVIGHTAIHVVAAGETLVDIAVSRRLGYLALTAANPRVDPWLPVAGTVLLLPTRHVLPHAPREGIVVNLAEFNLYAFSADGTVSVMAVGIGREGAETPLGETTVIGKRRDPVWCPPPSIRAEHPDLPIAVPPGPQNPLGPFALDLGWTDYLIHGTRSPFSIGRRATHGCIRLYNDQIADLFESVTVGTRVQVVDQPVKLGWSDGRLFLQVHPSGAESDLIESGDPLPPSDLATSMASVLAALQRFDRPVTVNWARVRIALQERRGIPVAISIQRPPGPLLPQ